MDDADERAARLVSTAVDGAGNYAVWIEDVPNHDAINISTSYGIECREDAEWQRDSIRDVIAAEIRSAVKAAKREGWDLAIGRALGACPDDYCHGDDPCGHCSRIQSLTLEDL